MTRTAITAPDAGTPIGPYRQAILADGRTLYVSGQIPLDPATGELAGPDIETQTRQVLANLKAILAQAGTGPEHVVKTTVFLQDLADFAAMNALYADHFPGDTPPARSTLQVAGLPKGARVEIECIALVPEG